MQTWASVDVPRLAGGGSTAAPARHGHRPGPADRARARRATMYVCGITPYDATHLGHAATYLAFDLVNRVWRDPGHDVHYVQNVTDIDDPLLERAARDRRRLGGARHARDRAVPRGHGGAAGLPAAALRRRGRVDPGEIAELVGELVAEGAAYRVDDAAVPATCTSTSP